MYNRRRILVIAGSDSSGGAGLEADQKVIAAHGCYAMTATTALTAQNTLGVSDIHHVPSSFVAKQIEACASDVGIDVVKTGMLASAETIRVVAQALEKHSISVNVVDPVMVATSGARLLPEDAIKTLISELLPRTYLLTPNIPEAQLILKEAGQSPGEINTVDDIKRLAKHISALGPKHVLVKGGHCPMPSPTNPDEKLIHNVLYSTTTSTHQIFSSPHLTSRNTHGTGCSLASAIASQLAIALCLPPSSTPPVLDPDLPRALSLSLPYVSRAISTSLPLGSGPGPINHLHALRPLPFPPGSFLPYLLSHPTISPLWHHYTHHPFVTQLSTFSLPPLAFRHYMVQDYLYLTSFARANALLAAKAATLELTVRAGGAVVGIGRETELHVAECERMGIGRTELDGAEEEVETIAYGAWVCDVVGREDWFGGLVALGSCMIGYGEVAEGIAARWRGDGAGPRAQAAAVGGSGSGERETEHLAAASPYARWVYSYVSDDYRDAVRSATDLLEAYAPRQSPERIDELVKIWAKATRLEIAFWDAALRAAEK
ncbi:hypothetical protein CAC42_3286 [Sphaceloma murrayae]|uniref:Hydroxymethylpyrimidine/phosphomethylpyrimidine kinase 2 n=1 Tax=Sphaceloma murrayae TaxID=2082308 RepID=A0A2K1QFZ5_9PEZI|nr:hypothetical protein CAC42_3286 [Sphaceloma murrayae]